MMTSKKDTISIAPQLLLKLRENTGYSENQAAKKADISAGELVKIEEGKKKVTITLIKKLSKAYEYPLVTFFEEKAPEQPNKLKDYRINRNKTINPEVKKAERRAYYLVNALEEISEEKSSMPEHLKDHTAVKLAGWLKEKIRLEKPQVKKADKALDHYKDELENKLGIVITESPLKNKDVRAFSINSRIPVVVLNESDKAEIKLFSLFHELCHLLQKKSTICSTESSTKDEVESYCNKFAAEILIPTNEIRRERTHFSGRNVSELSRKYFVSKHAVMIKLLNEKLITQADYSKFRNAFNEKIPEKNKKTSEKKKFGKRNWEKTYLKRVGKKAAKTVRNAYVHGRISTADALDILNVKSKYAEKFLGEGGYNGPA